MVRPTAMPEGRWVASNTYQTAHFIVTAPTASLAQRVAHWAEQARRDIYRCWFPSPQPLSCEGKEQSEEVWPRPVQVEVHREHPGYYATTFLPGGVVTITLWAGDAHLESTVRHEVWHAVVHLRYPTQEIPRWLDEGLAVCNESAAEQQRQLAPLFRTKRRFTIRQLAALREYPRDVLLFYAQSYSVCDFLVRQHGEKAVIRFLETSFRIGQEPALRQVLGYASFESLEQKWLQSLSDANACRQAA